jgi:5-methylcytosine-specific restriction endonuclease McrA
VPVLKLCKHGQLTATGRCSLCALEDNTRRNQLARRHGLNTKRWRLLRDSTLARDGHRCQQCGDPANTVHIDPKLKGNHNVATLNDTVTLCRRCHGSLDAARARGGP